MARRGGYPVLGRGRSRAPRRGKLTALLIFGAIAGLVIFLLQHAAAPRAAPHALVEPRTANPTPLTVCWLETGRVGGITSSALLVRHPRGDVLIDAGESVHFKEQIAPKSFLPRMLLRAFAGPLEPSLSIKDALRAAGVDAPRLQGVLISHLHADHLGGALDLGAEVPLWTRKEELDFASHERNASTFHVLPALADALKTRGVALAFSPVPFETFDESVDLFGDGSVVVVKLTGHTPGSLGTFIQLSAHRQLFHLGDAVDDSVEFAKGVGKWRAATLTDVDTKATLETVGKLTQLHTLAPNLEMLPAHDRGAYERAFEGAPRCIHSPQGPPK